MVPNRLTTFIILIPSVILTLAVASCGWQLRDLPTKTDKNISKKAGQTFSQKKPLNLVLKKRSVKLQNAIKQTLKQSHYIISNSSTRTLIIENEKIEKRPLAVTDTGVTAQYQLVLIIHYRYIGASGKVIIPSQKIMSWRSYDFDAKEIVTKNLEEIALIEEMRQELASRMVSAIKN